MPRQSPVIFWLLLAATICVDAVVFVSVLSEPFPAPPYTILAFSALILSQLSIACIWSALRASTVVWKLAMPVTAVVCAALAAATFSNDPVPFKSKFISYIPFCAFHAALLVAALWLLRRTAFWRRSTGDERPWQFSVAHLLIAMTVVAVLAFASRYVSIFSDYGLRYLISIPPPVLLAVMTVVIWSQAWNWLLRLAGVVGSALILAAFSALVTDLNSAFFTGVVLLIQGLVIAVWLAWGPILPPKHTSGATAAVE
jgi:hypothetical protein